MCAVFSSAFFGKIYVCAFACAHLCVSKRLYCVLVCSFSHSYVYHSLYIYLRFVCAYVGVFIQILVCTQCCVCIYTLCGYVCAFIRMLCACVRACPQGEVAATYQKSSSEYFFYPEDIVVGAYTNHNRGYSISAPCWC